MTWVRLGVTEQDWKAQNISQVPNCPAEVLWVTLVVYGPLSAIASSFYTICSLKTFKLVYFNMEKEIVYFYNLQCDRLVCRGVHCFC